jgi:hypothetical protein
MQRHSNAIANFGAPKIMSPSKYRGHPKSIALRVAALMAFNLKIASG